jgi:hypothetical protein
MAELRLVGVSEDGERLVLTDEAGVHHTIIIDERLRAGVHGHLSRLGQLTMALESRISPREIQNRVRSGESAEHVAQTAGVPVERVLRFVGPVLREREHVADQARRARLAGTNGPSPLLGDLVMAAAMRRSIDPDDIGWDSARREDHTWVVSTAWPDGRAALWGLDLLRHQATPLDSAARAISGLTDDGLDDGSSAPVRGFPDFTDSAEFARFDASESDEEHTNGEASEDNPADTAGTIGRSRGARGSTPGRRPTSRRDAPTSTSASDATESSTQRRDALTSTAPRRDASVHRLVPRTVPVPVRATSAESTDDQTDDDAITDAEASDVDAEQHEADESSVDSSTDESTENRPRSPSGRGPRRAAVPTWDDIMFGMKPKDGS